MIPVFTSPNTIPVNSPVTIGRESNDVPSAYSDCATNATIPNKTACTIIEVLPFLQNFSYIHFFICWYLTDFYFYLFVN